ncbi:DUF4240 domain-containing protein [Micromonosporaceae bacterium DT194]|uniref:DUF4240 domain-containing protein n=1 Tax=Melissospora conviva TaxID=3388432 RepID=UPI003C171EE2
MRTDEFWALIEAARATPGDSEEITERVISALADRPAEEILAFDRHLHRVLVASYREDLWGAAYLINGGASDDDFAHFRGWLMAQGRAVFARAVAEPDSLAELPAVQRAAVTGAEFGAAAMARFAAEAYRRATGEDPPVEEGRAAYPDLNDFWDFDDEEGARRRLPRLAALFLEPPQE